MQYNSYIVSETKTAFSIPMQTPIIKKNLKQKAFTLAETLITLSIIGVVAAMTIPTLMANQKKQQYATSLKKVYSNLQNAIQMIPMTEGCSNGDFECAEFNGYLVGSEADEKRAAMLAKHFKVVKQNLTFSNNDPTCKISGRGGSPCFQTEDGVVISTSIGIYADLNGTAGPNKLGRDQFYFAIAGDPKNGISMGTLLPMGSKIYANYQGNSNDYWKTSGLCNDDNIKKNDWNGAAQCTGRVLEEGKMDY